MRKKEWLGTGFATGFILYLSLKSNAELEAQRLKNSLKLAKQQYSSKSEADGLFNENKAINEELRRRDGGDDWRDGDNDDDPDPLGGSGERPKILVGSDSDTSHFSLSPETLAALGVLSALILIFIAARKRAPTFA